MTVCFNRDRSVLLLVFHFRQVLKHDRERKGAEYKGQADYLERQLSLWQLRAQSIHAIVDRPQVSGFTNSTMLSLLGGRDPCLKGFFMEIRFEEMAHCLTDRQLTKLARHRLSPVSLIMCILRKKQPLQRIV